ncbi:hypothetical protein BSPWISOXPB_458, partial [uncultured Gammaproteobacteria bacterium]
PYNDKKTPILGHLTQEQTDKLTTESQKNQT